ncbi:MAG: hypothetical protein ACEPOZ_06200 [Marinifilaceae bacterium]
MKTRLSQLMAIAMMAAMFACSAPKVAQVQQPDEVDFDVPCTGPEFRTNAEYFRASADGLSMNMDIAKKMAYTNARAELATAIEAKVERVTDNYSSSHNFNGNEEAKQRFQDLPRIVVKQVVSGTRVICEKMKKTKEGKFHCYVAMELAGDEIVKSMQDRISQDDKLKIDFEYEKFKKDLKEEMAKVGS